MTYKIKAKNYALSLLAYPYFLNANNHYNKNHTRSDVVKVMSHQDKVE